MHRYLYTYSYTCINLYALWSDKPCHRDHNPYMFPVLGRSSTANSTTKMTSKPWMVSFGQIFPTTHLQLHPVFSARNAQICPSV